MREDVPRNTVARQHPQRSYTRLPIEEHRDRIITHVLSHRITFIQGETGCGKSSMVPQFLHEQDPTARVLVTQPRRLAAITLRTRVASQMGKRGELLVGYRLGQGQRQETPDTRITFCTTGYLLAYLSHNPAALRHFKYIVLDEVHERTMDSDLLLLLTKLLLPQQPHVRLIIMSATLQPHIFGDYFADFDPDLSPLKVWPLWWIWDIWLG